MALQMAGSGQVLLPELPPVSAATGRNCCWVIPFMASWSWYTESVTLLVIFTKILSRSDSKWGICPAHSFRGVQSTHRCGKATGQIGRLLVHCIGSQKAERTWAGRQVSLYTTNLVSHELCPSARLHPVKGPELSKAAPTVVDSIQTREPVGHVTSKPWHKLHYRVCVWGGVVHVDGEARNRSMLDESFLNSFRIILWDRGFH